MYPYLFQYKIINIAGYGVMLGMSFYFSFLLMERELIVRGKDPELAYKLILMVIPSAIIGAKIFHIIENFSEFLLDPSGMIFSGAGLSVQGGFFLALLGTIYIIKKSNEKILDIFDIASPCMALGYAIGRFACHVAGDGCYGITSASFLGCSYPNGVIPTSIPVLPTPLFESVISFLILVALLQLRKRETVSGQIFFIYLILNGLPRFFIEFVRLNPQVVFGLTQAQLVAIGFMLTGIIGLVLVMRRARMAQS